MDNIVIYIYFIEQAENPLNMLASLCTTFPPQAERRKKHTSLEKHDTEQDSHHEHHIQSIFLGDSILDDL
jgi:hypothetical protein